MSYYSNQPTYGQHRSQHHASRSQAPSGYYNPPSSYSHNQQYPGHTSYSHGTSSYQNYPSSYSQSSGSTQNPATQSLVPSQLANGWFLDRGDDEKPPAFRRHPAVRNNLRTSLRVVKWRSNTFDAFSRNGPLEPAAWEGLDPTEWHAVKVVQHADTWGLKNADVAEIRTSAHVGGSDPNSPFHLSVRYFRPDGTKIQCMDPKGKPGSDTWHVNI